ncbi:Phosphoacetylglucosamine mutase [Tubulinosema ratisbonensis]|uniref:Phosphoacetylglucosamine mutase n=1 Tax=Tubulinosema ratisbonensis TaxID=291195 RepID=A0A437ALU7_9MICR|nr:Phosphoacetylglucosamine mutase [Tubulinosema ratisbonensis]
MNSKKILPNLLRRFYQDLKIPSETGEIFRLALLSHIRSSTFAAKFIGLYVTPKPVIIDHTGEQLDDTWQKYQTELLITTEDSLHITLNRIHRKVGQMKDFGDGLPSRILIYTHPVYKTKLQELFDMLESEIFFYDEVFFAQFCFFVKHSNLNDSVLNYKNYLLYLTNLITFLSKDNLVKHSPIKTKSKIINKMIEELNLDFKNDDVLFCELSDDGLKYFKKGNLVDTNSLLAKLATEFYRRGKSVAVFLPPCANITSIKYLETVAKIISKEDVSLKDYKDNFEVVLSINQNNLVSLVSNLKDYEILCTYGDPLVSYFIFDYLVDFFSVLFEELPNRFIEISIKNKVECVKFNKVDELLRNNKCTGKIQSVDKKIKIFVEGRNQRQVDECAVDIAQYLYDNCEGVGYHPEINY